jgi:hypothetical protein
MWTRGLLISGLCLQLLLFFPIALLRHLFLVTAKDSSLFEARAHNFNVLMEDEEASGAPAQGSEFKDHSESVHAAHATAALSGDNDGFETFSATRKHRAAGTRRGSASGPSGSAAPSAFRPVNAARPSAGPKVNKELLRPSPESTLELFDFPSDLKTGHLRQFLHAFDGGYQLKWNNDTSCFAIFSDVSVVDKAFEELKSDLIKVRRYVEPEQAESLSETQ